MFGLNNRKEIIGCTADSTFRDIHGFLRNKHGEFTTIDVPDGSNTMALDINDFSAIVGAYEKTTSTTELRHAGATTPNRLTDALLLDLTRAKPTS